MSQWTDNATRLDDAPVAKLPRAGLGTVQLLQTPPLLENLVKILAPVPTILTAARYQRRRVITGTGDDATAAAAEGFSTKLSNDFLLHLLPAPAAAAAHVDPGRQGISQGVIVGVAAALAAAIAAALAAAATAAAATALAAAALALAATAAAGTTSVVAAVVFVVGFVGVLVFVVPGAGAFFQGRLFTHDTFSLNFRLDRGKCVLLIGCGR